MWPLTLNSKIDRARLPALSASSAQAAQRGASSMPSKRAVQAAWATTLGTSVDGIDENTHFFEAGGHSLLATLACTRTAAALGMSVKPGLLLAHPVFDAFCDALRTAEGDADPLPPLVASPHAMQGVCR